eukprot:CAMPEP_0172483188 /NCGR_PEP_ID=MMETSP1066-20121228/10079_1 /TAXON_ID=671091 /ORGANISM="Coscinodiscus wailesii, Strain CCMP2513" /LENGTH=48 /DNA_ID= /DNA_START= /DNA_END= /DNA_ORIENTATION=
MILRPKTKWTEPEQKWGTADGSITATRKVSTDFDTEFLNEIDGAIKPL